MKEESAATDQSLEQRWAEHFGSTITEAVADQFNGVLEEASPELADLLVGLVRYSTLLGNRFSSRVARIDLRERPFTEPNMPSVIDLFCRLNPKSQACVGSEPGPDNPLDTKEEETRAGKPWPTPTCTRLVDDLVTELRELCQLVAKYTDAIPHPDPTTGNLVSTRPPLSQADS